MKIEQAPSLRQKLLITQAMRQAFEVLQMPNIELVEWLKNEIELNPALETPEYTEEMDPPFPEEQELDFSEIDFSVYEHLDENFSIEEEAPSYDFDPEYKITLYDHLIAQAKLAFPQNDSYSIAEFLIGNLNEKGFFTDSLKDLAELLSITKEDLLPILKKIQTFDPSGIAVNNIQYSLLLQLNHRGMKNSLAYKIVDDHFEDLIHNRLSLLQKKIKCSMADIQRAIFNDLGSLSLNPGSPYRQEANAPIVADLKIENQDGNWIVDVNEDNFPPIRFSKNYTHFSHNLEIKKFINSGKWLQTILERRHKTLRRIGLYIIEKQKDYLEGNVKTPFPLRTADLALELDLNESTISRAIAHKYVSLPDTLIPIRMFFSPSLHSFSGKKVSTITVKDSIVKLIEAEDKNAPLTDEQIVFQLQAQGIKCARRTIAKYRNQLKIPSTSKRKKWTGM